MADRRADPVGRFVRVAGIDDLAGALLERYREPHRRYHDTEHLAEVLGWIDEWAGLAADPEAVELAAWYHDAVYDPAALAGESEQRSAELAVVELTAANVSPGLVDEVERLVLLTAGHTVTGDDRNGGVLADADLAILGADADRYARYTADVRAEYAHVDDAAWAAGRTAVLRGFAGRTRIFVTDQAHERLDAAARRNLARELATLLGPA